jgi:phosphohistidine phosphatase SixA
MPAGRAFASGADDAWRALAAGNVVAIMRHALAPGTGDPPEFRLDDCSTQRNLDSRGRAQARAVGDAMRRRGVKVDLVLTSQWCRARETAELLGFRNVSELPALNSFFANRSQAARQTRELEAAIRGLAEGGTAILVSHQVNITALTGIYPASGEIVVGRMKDGGFDVVGRIRPFIPEEG